MKLKDNVYQAQSFLTVPRYILVPNLEILTSIIGDLSRGQAWSKWVKMWQRISISPGISKLFKPQNNMIRNLCVLHRWSTFSHLRLNGWGVMAQTITGLTHTQTEIRRQWQYLKVNTTCPRGPPDIASIWTVVTSPRTTVPHSLWWNPQGWNHCWTAVHCSTPQICRGCLVHIWTSSGHSCSSKIQLVSIWLLYESIPLPHTLHCTIYNCQLRHWT